MDIEPICRCGTERIVNGAAITCPHCDNPCTGICYRCVQLSRTCTDCRILHFTTKSRALCETSHHPMQCD